MKSAKNRRSYLRRMRKKLWEKNPHCYYCGKPTVLPARRTSQGPVPPDTATIEHLISRQQGTGDRESRLVLSCWQCNNDRNRAEQLAENARQRQALQRYGFLLKNVID